MSKIKYDRNPVKVIAPNGRNVTIPMFRLKEHLTKGFKLDMPDDPRVKFQQTDILIPMYSGATRVDVPYSNLKSFVELNFTLDKERFDIMVKDGLPGSIANDVLEMVTPKPVVEPPVKIKK